MSSRVFYLALAVLFSAGAAYAAGDVNNGKKIFGGVCESCHGVDGVVEIPGIPSFANGDRLEKTDAQLKQSIIKGVNNPDNPSGMSMVPYGGGPKLSDKEVDDVIAYIRSLKKQAF